MTTDVYLRRCPLQGVIIATCKSAWWRSCTDGRLHQEVAPELKALRQEPSWTASDLQMSVSQSVAVQHVRGPSWFAEFTVKRGDASACGLLLCSWLHEEPDQAHPCAAACWSTGRTPYWRYTDLNGKLTVQGRTALFMLVTGCLRQPLLCNA